MIAIYIRVFLAHCLILNTLRTSRVPVATFLGYPKETVPKRCNSFSCCTPFKVSTVLKIPNLSLKDGIDNGLNRNDKIADKDNSTKVYLKGKSEPAKEKDLFIPIFVLVSISGFAGLYLYEILRLYSKGELYLPWNN
mmetsp:Transcript_26941/g.38649  ORF Transcript_26941/g.38649 Transcript_26941/m.38649 type:complete len:137 (+) Transcript_26941:32-442(+)